MAVGQLLSASHNRWKLKLPLPGLRPFDGVLLAGNSGLKRSDAVSSHSNPDVLMGHVEHFLIFREELSFFGNLLSNMVSCIRESAMVSAQGRRTGVENGEKHFQYVSSCSAQVFVSPGKTLWIYNRIFCLYRFEVAWKQNTLSCFRDQKDGDLERLSCHHSQQHLSARGTTLKAAELRIRLRFIFFECKHRSFFLKTCRYSRGLLTIKNSQNSVRWLRTLWKLFFLLLILYRRLFYGIVNQTFWLM